jgi:hypothetical protein
LINEYHDIDAEDTDWESVQAHVDFTKVPAFSAVATALKELCAAPANVFHTHIQPFPPTELYQAVVVELAVLAKKPDVSLDQFNKISEVFFERVQKQPGYRCHFRGIKHEDNNVHIHFVGWDSVEVGTLNCIHTDKLTRHAALVL